MITISFIHNHKLKKQFFLGTGNNALQDNFDLISGQDFVILQIDRWIDENNEVIKGWFGESEKPLKKH